MSSELIGELGYEESRKITFLSSIHKVGLKIEEAGPVTLTQSNDCYSGDEKKKPRLSSNHRPKKFRQAWMMFDIFKDWLRPHSSPEFATCIVCNRVIKAGKSELEKHAAGKRHQMLRGSANTATVLIGQDLIASDLPVSISISGDSATVGGDGGGGAATTVDDYTSVTCMETASFSTGFTESGNEGFHQPPHQPPHQPAHQPTSQPTHQPTQSRNHHQVTPPVETTEITTKAIIGRAAPHWRASAIVNGHVIKLDLNDYRGRYLVLFFYPHDFDRVCAHEIITLSERIGEFRSESAEVVACSVDSQLCHLNWAKQSRAEGGLGNPKVPLLADPTHSIASDYGVLVPEKGHSLRGTFIIDRKGVIRVMHVYDQLLGRGIDELLRAVQALHFSDETEEAVMPDWSPQTEPPCRS